MASRSMHLALAYNIARKIEIEDFERFKLGMILPDAYAAGLSTARSHLKTKICDGKKSTYQLAHFRERYGSDMVQDDLYMGYYMHLIQDVLFRHFVYDEYQWDPRPEGNVDRLHNDYRLLNGYVIPKYGVVNQLNIPCDIQKEALFEIYPFDLNQLVSDFQKDFVAYTAGTAFFFTGDMADAYIERATQKCIMEIKALKKGAHIIDEMAYAWDSHS